MWASIATKAGQLLLTYLVMPLLSKLLVSIAKYYSDKKEESERKAAIDAAVKKYEESKTSEEQKRAFLELVRARKL